MAIFVAAILEKLLSQENRVLEYWTAKKKRLDQNQQYCLFERSARQSLAWIKEEGDIYLSTHVEVGKTKDETRALLEEHNSFKVPNLVHWYCFWYFYMLFGYRRKQRKRGKK